jgi:hypothetical protein
MDIDESGNWKPHIANSPALLVPKISKAVTARKKINKISIDSLIICKQYLDYLWELGELPVFTIGGFGISVSLRYNYLYIVRIRGSSNVPILQWKHKLSLDFPLSVEAISYDRR